MYSNSYSKLYFTFWAWSDYRRAFVSYEMNVLGKTDELSNNMKVKSVQSALSDLSTTSATHGMFSRPSTKRGLISIIKLMQFTIAHLF